MGNQNQGASCPGGNCQYYQPQQSVAQNYYQTSSSYTGYPTSAISSYSYSNTGGNYNLNYY
jgi:hypothetical protein